MKKFILSVILLVTLSSFSDTTYVVKGVCINTELEAKILSSYCDGFSKGYKDGYCYNQFGCIEPIPPLCPIKGINEENSYKGGYNRGFILGRKQQN